LKWYKHLAQSIHNPFIRSLMYEFGSDAYLVFFGTLEIYADNYVPSVSWEFCVETRFLRDELLISNSKLQKILTRISQNPNIEDRWKVEFNKEQVAIFIPKFKKLVDNYTKDNNPESCKSLASEKQETFQPIRIKNKDKRIKNKENNTPPEGVFVLPSWIPEETWKAYLEVRNKKKAAKTPYALNLIIKKLEKIRHENKDYPVAVLNQSITSGWSDVYPLKKDNIQKQPFIKQESPYENCSRCGKELRKGYEYTEIGGQKCCEYCPEARAKAKVDYEKLQGMINIKSL